MSKTVKILRRKNNTRLPEEVYALSKRRIGAYSTANGVIKTGLTREEEEKILPFLLNVSPTSPEFLTRKEDYYNNITINVPIEGVELEVGLDKKGNPINPDHYVKYKFILDHPWVGKNKQELNHNSRKYFYIHDESLEKEKKAQSLEVRKRAYKEFIKLSSNEAKVNMVITMFGEDLSKMDEKEKDLFLEHEATANPGRFLEIVTDSKLEMKAFIKDCVSHEVLNMVGTSILEGDEVLGHSMEEAVIKLEDKANSEILARLKAKLYQFKK